MKKLHIVFNVTLGIILIALIWCMIIGCKNLSGYIREVQHFIEIGRIHEDRIFQYYVLPTIEYSILVFFNVLALLSCIFIFVYSNPKLFRKSTYTDISAEWAKNNAERAAAKQTKAEAEKQKQIAELEEKLNELKKDDSSS